MIRKNSLGGLALMVFSPLSMAKTYYADVQVSHLQPAKDQALYNAKKSGRNRCIIDPQSI